jgi:hypothetical protein
MSRVEAREGKIKNTWNGANESKSGPSRQAQQGESKKAAAQGNENYARNSDEEDLVSTRDGEKAKASLQKEEPEWVKTIGRVDPIEGEEGRVQGMVGDGQVVEAVRGEVAEGALDTHVEERRDGRVSGQGHCPREDEKRLSLFRCHFLHRSLLSVAWRRSRVSNSCRQSCPVIAPKADSLLAEAHVDYLYLRSKISPFGLSPPTNQYRSHATLATNKLRHNVCLKNSAPQMATAGRRVETKG